MAFPNDETTADLIASRLRQGGIVARVDRGLYGSWQLPSRGQMTVFVAARDAKRAHEILGTHPREDSPPSPFHQFAIAFLVVALLVSVVVLAVAVWLSARDTYTPRLEAYEVSADSGQITVAFCGTTAETVAAQSLRKDDINVVVEIRVRMERGFFNGTVHKATFALRTPLGNRIVRDASGNPLPHGSQFVCPG